MSTYNLRRFSSTAGLKAIKPKHLWALLTPHSPYFADRGFILPPAESSGEPDYELLVDILMSPDASTPAGLLDALYLVHEMATPESMDVLLQEAEDKGISLDGDPDPTAADVAVQLYLQNKNFLERKHAEQYLSKPRSFEYFQTEKQPLPEFRQPSLETLTGLERDLDDWLEKKKRGRGLCFPPLFGQETG